ncbi:ATPase inhibitor subunit zeta [Rhizobium aegyptiacum]|uniref:ATPase inhibitor subunit zeta n=1 Tax=Rhizobium aegyptiacum TaxID=1764550 RepID=UPI0009EF18FB|nr:ATPase inhibitor subunit zeta [Rhizobium aegyptiacum]
MMGIIDEREEALEKEYIMKLERSFHIRARRDRMLARWAAELIGRNDFDVYFDEVISAGLLASGDEKVFKKVLSDLQYADLAINAQTVREKMEQLLLEAARSLDEAG